MTTDADGTAKSRTTAFQLDPRAKAAMTLRLSSLMFLLYGASDAFSQVPMQVISGSMLLFPHLALSPRMWWMLTLTLVASNTGSWYALDNHKYLMTYWALACALSLSTPDVAKALRGVSRVLIAIVFSAAVIWKLLASQFASGALLYFTFLTDPRLVRVTEAFVGTARDNIAVISDAMRYIGVNGLTNVSVPVIESRSLALVALALSLGGLAMEGFVAIVHALPNRRSSQVRHISLMAFIVLTYFMLPVFPFAVILIVLGFAQADEDDGRTRLLYLMLLGLMHLTLVPWQDFLWPRT